tara:strand:- start:30 stop:368 length:339 start_codon:yes stop_codon:yes gene_type:complete
MNINKKTFPNPYKRRKALLEELEDIARDMDVDKKNGHETDVLLSIDKQDVRKEIRKWHKDFVNLDNHENCWIYPDCLSNHPHVAGEPVWEAPPSGMDGCLWQQETPTRFGSR